MGELIRIEDGPVATVYSGHRGGVPMALKVFPRRFDKRTLSAFNKEQAKLATMRRVPSILAVTAVGEADGGASALWMELCAHSLARLMERMGRLAASDVVVLGHAMATALAAAHGAGVIHGGVSPSNVLFRFTGDPVLSDFGVTLRHAFSRDPLHAIEYLPPESLRSGTLNESTDLYGLGAVLHFALSGRSPHPGRLGEQPGERVLRILGEPVPALTVPNVPIGLSTLVARLLSATPDRRPADATTVAQQLATMLPATAPRPPQEDWDDFVPVPQTRAAAPTYRPQPPTAPDDFDDFGTSAPQIPPLPPGGPAAGTTFPPMPLPGGRPDNASPMPSIPFPMAGTNSSTKVTAEGTPLPAVPPVAPVPGAPDAPPSAAVPIAPASLPVAPVTPLTAAVPVAAAPVPEAPVVSPSVAAVPVAAVPVVGEASPPSVVTPPSAAAPVPEAPVVSPSVAAAPVAPEPVPETPVAPPSAAVPAAAVPVAGVPVVSPSVGAASAAPVAEAPVAPPSAAAEPVVSVPVTGTAVAPSVGESLSAGMASPVLAAGAVEAPPPAPQPGVAPVAGVALPAAAPGTPVPVGPVGQAPAAPPSAGVAPAASPDPAAGAVVAAPSVPVPPPAPTTPVPAVVLGAGAPRLPLAPPPVSAPSDYLATDRIPATYGDDDVFSDFGDLSREHGRSGVKLLTTVSPGKQKKRGRLIRYDLLAGAALLLALLAMVPLLLLRSDPEEISTAPQLPGANGAGDVEVELAEPTDLTDKVRLTWTASREFDFAVVVAAEGQEARVLLAERTHSMTVEVEPGIQYCFLVQATDGDRVYESEPVPLRGATCRE